MTLCEIQDGGGHASPSCAVLDRDLVRALVQLTGHTLRAMRKIRDPSSLNQSMNF